MPVAFTSLQQTAKNIRSFQLSAAASSAVPAEKPAKYKTFAIYRWNPDKPDEKPTMQEYKVDLNKWVVHYLEGLNLFVSHQQKLESSERQFTYFMLWMSHFHDQSWTH